MPDGNIDIPGLGKVPDKYAVGAVLSAIAIAVVVYFRARNKAAQAAAQAASSQSSGTTANMVTDPAGNQCAALDPNSGYCPGSPEDEQYQAAYGYGAGDLADYGVGDSTAGYVTDPAGNICTAVDPATGYCPGTPEDTAAGGGGSVSSTPSTTITTNAQWVTAALAILPGGNSSANQIALANVLGGIPVTSAQQQVFLEAVGLIGQPPQGYPTINLTDTSAQPSSGSGTGAASSGSWKYPAPGGLRASGAGAGRISVSWSGVKGPSGQVPGSYTVAYGRTSGAQTWKNQVSGTSTVLQTQNGMTEYIEVWANGGPIAPPHAGPVKATAGK
jgi:hypothetical protein